MAIKHFVQRGQWPCQCEEKDHLESRSIVLTGGPSAGKTYVFDTAKSIFCRHVVFIPEAATIVYNQGTQKGYDVESTKKVQQLIFSAQRKLEEAAHEMDKAKLFVYDRCVIDGLAYWPDTESSFWVENGGGDKQDEFDKFALVLHMSTPKSLDEYSLETNSTRTESLEDAEKIDKRIYQVWAGHPNRIHIEPVANFTKKVDKAIGLMRNFLQNSE